MDPSLLEPQAQSARRTMMSRVLRFGLSSSNPVMPTFSILRSVQCPKLAGVSCFFFPFPVTFQQTCMGPTGVNQAPSINGPESQHDPFHDPFDLCRCHGPGVSRLPERLLKRLQDHHWLVVVHVRAGKNIHHGPDHLVVVEQALHLHLVLKCRPPPRLVVVLGGSLGDQLERAFVLVIIQTIAPHDPQIPPCPRAAAAAAACVCSQWLTNMISINGRTTRCQLACVMFHSVQER